MAVDPAMADVVAQARRLAVMSVPIWIDGERGSGKSVLAQVVHRESRRAWQPFIRVPCANLAPRDVDRARLGFRNEVAGAAADAVGHVERADGGTLFLEGVDALPAAGHALLLRALDERAITPVGDTRRLHVDVRVVASSGGRDVGPRVGPSGRLYERLRGAVLAVPPLRERPLDVASLAERFLALAGDGRALGPGVAHALRAHRWPGNVRELRDAMGFARALASGDAIGLDDLPRAVREPADPQDGDDPLVRDAQREACERSAVMLALAAAGDVAGAARVLEVSRGALRASIERLGLGPRELGVPD